MKLVKLIFCALIIFLDSFSVTVSSKDQQVKTKICKISFGLFNKKPLKEKIEELIKSRADINAVYEISETKYFLLDFAIFYAQDMESVKLLLDNGANPNIEYTDSWSRKSVLLDKMSSSYMLLPKTIKLPDFLRKKYKQITRILVFAGSDISNCRYPDEEILNEYKSKLAEELSKADILLSVLRDMVLDYLTNKINIKEINQP